MIGFTNRNSEYDQEILQSQTADKRTTSPITLNQHKNRNNVVFASLKRETIGKLINSIPGSRLLISSLAMSTCVLKALPGKLEIKRHSPSILYILLKALTVEHTLCKMNKRYRKGVRNISTKKWKINVSKI